MPLRGTIRDEKPFFYVILMLKKNLGERSFAAAQDDLTRSLFPG
jgi:hypothetical protein